MAPSNGPSATSFTPGPNFKLGAMKKKCGGFQKWAVRYLILDKPNKILYYYHSTKDASPKRSLDLNTCTISRLTPDESPKDPGFKVTQPGVRDFIFIGSNAAIVDDWVNAIFQAKAPTQNTTQSFIAGVNGTRSPISPVSPGSGPPKTGTATSDNFSYNGPTLAVLPNRGSTAMASPPSQIVPFPNQQMNQMANQQYTQPARQTARPTPASARSTQSSVTENNTTLVGNGGGDTNSTLVAGAASNPIKIAAGQPVPVIVLTPDNKKFPPLERAVVGILKIGRYVNNQPQSEDMVTFKSKVISRNHSEIWSVNGEVYIRDTKSQSGTFLNAMRLSEPSKESKPYRLKPGDVIQFGVDYKGATEDNARCISVRVDLKTKILDPLPQSGLAGIMATDRSTGTENMDTLVGNAGGDGTTLVGGGQKGGRTNVSGDGTLFGQGQNDGTLYSNQQQVDSQQQYYNGGPPMYGGGIPPRPQMMPNRPPPMNVPGMSASVPRQGPQILSAPGGVVAGPGMRPPIGQGFRPPPMGMQR